MKRAMVCALASAWPERPPAPALRAVTAASRPGRHAALPEAVKNLPECGRITVAELARKLTDAIGTEVRVQAARVREVDAEVCAPTPEAALAQIATALHARWRPAFVFGGGAPAQKPGGDERAVTVVFRAPPQPQPRS